MSNELEKWRGELERCEGNRREGSDKIDQALARIGEKREPWLARWVKERRAAIIRERNEVGLSGKARAGEVVDLLRTCALHDKFYMARYVGDANGIFQYAQSFRASLELRRAQYGRREQRVVPIEFTKVGEEACAWCGAVGHSAILCKKCGRLVCYGRTVARRQFLCRPSCGQSGQLLLEVRSETGMVPSLDPNDPASFMS
jgi:hypothetical protein